MPTLEELQTIKDQQEEAIRQRINARSGSPLDETLLRYRQDILPRFSLLQPTIQKAVTGLNLPYTGVPFQLQSGRLEDTLKSALGKTRLESQRKAQELGLSQRERLARESDIGLKEFTGFSRDIESDESRRAFEGSEREKDREHQLALDSIKDEFFRQGLDVRGQDEGLDYESALTRALTSLAGVGVSSYLQNRYLKNLSNLRSPIQQYSQPIGPQFQYYGSDSFPTDTTGYIG